MKRILACLLLVLLPLAGACQGSTGDTAEQPATTDTAAADEHLHDAAAPAAGDSAAAGEQDALALRPIMQQLATAMAGLGQALWVEDYQTMAGYAERIAGHSHIAPDELLRISTTLGPDTAGFTAADEAVHEASVRLRDAVVARDRDAILARLAEVQQGCVACHSRFRERLKTTQP